MKKSTEMEAIAKERQQLEVIQGVAKQQRIVDHLATEEGIASSTHKDVEDASRELRAKQRALARSNQALKRYSENEAADLTQRIRALAQREWEESHREQRERVFGLLREFLEVGARMAKLEGDINACLGPAGISCPFVELFASRFETSPWDKIKPQIATFAPDVLPEADPARRFADRTRGW